MASEEKPAAQYLSQTPISNLYGVGGWLLFFCISTTLIQPIYLLRELVASHTLIFMAVYSTRLLVKVVAGLALWRVAKGALELLCFDFIISVIYCAGLLILASHMSDTPSLRSGRSSQTAAIVASAAQFIGVLVWYGYFHFSRRVQNTYGRNL